MSDSNKDLKKLQFDMLRIQQGIFHKKERLIIAIEGVDAAGKGGAIRRLTDGLDPRSFRVHPIGAPSAKVQGKHYLYRFWKKLPAKGMIAVFDRTWYGRVLVERVEKLITKETWERAYDEINAFEKMLTDDGVILIKIFLKISKKEQHKRFEARLDDPYKQWKITEDDIRNRKNWDAYKKAQDDLFKYTGTDYAPWYIVDTDDKDEAREEVLKIVLDHCNEMGEWMENEAHLYKTKELKKQLKKMK